MRFPGGFNRVDIVNWGTANARIYRYHTNTESAVWETLHKIRHEGHMHYKSTVMQRPLVTQGFNFTEDWKTVWFGTAMKFVLERKTQG